MARSSEGRRKSKEDYGAMAVQDDLESKLANSALDSSSSRLPSTRGASSDGERIGANEGSVSLGDNGAELDEKIGGAEVEGNMFMNIWHEYLFIFVVTSAQLITVSFCQSSNTCDRGINHWWDGIASKLREYCSPDISYLAGAWITRV